MALAIKLLARGGVYTQAQTDDKQVCISSSDDDAAQDLTDFKDALNLVSADITLSTSTVITTPYTVLSTDDIVLVDDDTINAAAIVNLPPCSSLPGGFTVVIKKIGNSHNVTIDPSGSDTIDGGADAVLTTPFEAIRITSNGSHWYIF